MNWGRYAPIPQEKPTEGTRFTIREMKPSEAVEVAKLIYRAYGYSYAVEHFYYPERIEEYNRYGFLLSHVAVTEENEIAAHGAMVRRERWPRIVELGQGVVRPEFRGQGCFNLLTGHMVERPDLWDTWGFLPEESRRIPIPSRPCTGSDSRIAQSRSVMVPGSSLTGACLRGSITGLR